MTVDSDRVTSDADLADEYNRFGVGDADDWGDPEPLQRSPRLDVTISVRFSQAEIAEVRRRAAAAGMKPTAFIRQCALSAPDGQLDRQAVARSVAVISRAAEALRKLAG